MKKHILSIALIALTQFSIGQTNDSKLLEIYSQEKIDQLESDSPQLISYLEKFAIHGLRIEDVTDAKYYTEIPQLTEIPLLSKSNETISIASFLQAYDSPSFNALKYQFRCNQVTQVFFLVGTNKVLVVESFENLQAL